jgi:hypothetical protein
VSMYLPNPDLGPTGSEPGEFIDLPLPEVPVARGPLSDQARIEITRRAGEYIAALVRDHHGDRDDVRTVIHDLHLECTLAHEQ